MIEAALERINPIFREAVVLRDISDLSYEEIAEVLGVSLGTVKSRILRGREALREELAGSLKPRPPRDWLPRRQSDAMSCENVQERISLLLDSKLADGEREHVLAHLESL